MRLCERQEGGREGGSKTMHLEKGSTILVEQRNSEYLVPQTPLHIDYTTALSEVMPESVQKTMCMGGIN